MDGPLSLNQTICLARFLFHFVLSLALLRCWNLVFLIVPLSELFESALFLSPGKLRCAFSQFWRSREAEGFGDKGLRHIILLHMELWNDNLGGV